MPSVWPSMGNILNSPQIGFRIGHKAKPFSVHKAAIEFLSPKLVALQASEEVQPDPTSITLRGIDEATFTRLVEYAYRHDYTVPGLKASPNPPNHSSVSLSLYEKLEQGDEFSDTEPFITRARIKFHNEAMKPHVNLNNAVSHDTVEEMKVSGHCGHFDVFDAHIALYNLARQYDIHPLESLCKKRFRQSLLFMHINEHTIIALSDILDCVEHGALSTPGDEIRDILLDYFLANFYKATAQRHCT
ncbi:hypothetical protein BDP55DRAFT_638057 [Colletotrichum godetiae]|uniref:BTB domain-containing protein n=1 Tax=Colletotrichum godetiae TaxID=1209918 RepID=A0AAJ0A7Y3_9PEZI|nr:uncharacterized protein BDP55DRAFT_638057 [Colletotrichum godetiae]KAK1658191.1 hypothetical protein BDP55DRAFT_638057 [Colletotrichum godetiae]